MDLSTNAFRRLPNGIDRQGATYTIFNFFQTTGGWCWWD